MDRAELSILDEATSYPHFKGVRPRVLLNCGGLLHEAHPQAVRLHLLRFIYSVARLLNAVTRPGKAYDTKVLIFFLAHEFANPDCFKFARISNPQSVCFYFGRFAFSKGPWLTSGSGDGL